MSGDKQSQKAGDNAQLMQARAINIYNGIDEKRAREICAETYAIARKDFTREAYACANKRVQQLEDLLLPKIMQVEGALSAFSDPSFQLLLTNAQKAAAATEREEDYDLLAELLVNHIKEGDSRKVRAGVSLAIEIVDKVDNDALCALTVAYTMKNRITPSVQSYSSYLKPLSDMYDKLIYSELPTGGEWIEHLDILGAVRINNSRRMNTAEEYFQEQFEGYSAVGININDQKYNKALELLYSVRLPRTVLIPNEFLDGYVKIPVQNRNQIKNFKWKHCLKVQNENVIFENEVNKQQISVLEQIWDLYEDWYVLDKLDYPKIGKVHSKFLDKWEKYPSLHKLRQWWCSTSLDFDITSVGTALARTNIYRCDKAILEP